MMQSRVWSFEEAGGAGGGKESGLTARAASHHIKILPLRFIQLFLLFLVLSLGVSVGSMYMMRYFGMLNVSPVVPFTIHPSCEEPSNIHSWVRPPSNLLHHMNDTELLWRASFVPQIKDYPFKRVGKIAFMFLTKGPLPMAPLWERFFKGHEELYSIYVHASPSYIADYPPSSVFYKRQIPSQVTEWGMMSMCEAERRLLANALLDVSNEWFVLLSEACIPLLKFRIVYRYISKSRYSFMGSFDEIGPNGRGRYSENMEPEVNLSDWRKGAQWFEVNRELAVQIVQDTVYYPLFRDYCTPPCYVDEHYLQTMLSIETPYLLANRTLTYVDWSRGGAHPATFGRDDIKVGLFKRIFESSTCFYNGQPSSLCYLFARKFAPSALEPLMEIAPRLLGY